MTVIATTSDQVLLATLCAVRDKHSEMPIAAVVEAYLKFQAATGAIIYGSPQNQTEGTVGQDLGVDLDSLVDRVMIKPWAADGVLEITLIALPVAASFRLVSPFDRIPDFLREARKGIERCT